MGYLKTFLIASLVIANVAAQYEDDESETRRNDPEFCSTRATPFTCISKLFTTEILRKISTLQDVNLASISETTDENVFNTKLDAFDTFCKPFINTTLCGKAGNWWECSRDIEAVTTLVNDVQDTINGANKTEWYLHDVKIQIYLRYAGLICNESTGLRELLKGRKCIADAFDKASDHFRNIQLHRLSGILSGQSFAGKCNQARNGVVDLMEIVDGGCSSEMADRVFRFISASFTIVPGYSAVDCPINRTREALNLVIAAEERNETSSANIEEKDPEWCLDYTSPDKYRCFAQNLKADILAKTNMLEGLNPILAVTLTPAELKARVDTVRSTCAFHNATNACANDWWMCKVDVASITELINDLQDFVNGPGHEDWRLSKVWIQRHFSYSGYLCNSTDLDDMVANQACIKQGLDGVQPAVNRLSAILSTRSRFTNDMCTASKPDIRTIVDAVKGSCPNSGLDQVTLRLLIGSFTVIDGFSMNACNLLN